MSTTIKSPPTSSTSTSTLASSSPTSSSLFSEDESKFMRDSFHSVDSFDPFTVGNGGFKVPSLLPGGLNHPIPVGSGSGIESSWDGFGHVQPQVAQANYLQNQSNQQFMPSHHLRPTSGGAGSGSNSNSSRSPNSNSSPSTHQPTQSQSPFLNNSFDHSSTTTTNSFPQPTFAHHSSSMSPPTSHPNSSSSPHSFNPHSRHNSLGSATWNDYPQQSNHQHQLSNSNSHLQSAPHFQHPFHPSQSQPTYPWSSSPTATSSIPPIPQSYQTPNSAYGQQWQMEQLNFLQSESMKFVGGNRARAESSSSQNTTTSNHSGDSNSIPRNRHMVNPFLHVGSAVGGTAVGEMGEDHLRRHSLAGYINSNHLPLNTASVVEDHQEFQVQRQDGNRTGSVSSGTSASGSGSGNGNRDGDGFEGEVEMITPQPTGNGRNIKMKQNSNQGMNATSQNRTSSSMSNGHPQNPSGSATTADSGTSKDLSMLGLSFPSVHTFPSSSNPSSKPATPKRSHGEVGGDDVEMKDGFEGQGESFSNKRKGNQNGKSSEGEERSGKRRSLSPNSQQNNNSTSNSFQSASNQIPTSWSLMSYSQNSTLGEGYDGGPSLKPISIDPERGRGLLPTELENLFWTTTFDKRQPHLEDLKIKNQNNPIGNEKKEKGKGKERNGDKEKPALLTEAEKKANHIASEQKRRANIRKGYELLCNIIPPLREALEKEKKVGGGRRGGMAFTGLATASGTGTGVKNEEEDEDGKGKKTKGKGNANEDGSPNGNGNDGDEKMDGRAGPRSEGIVLMKCK